MSFLEVWSLLIVVNLMKRIIGQITKTDLPLITIKKNRQEPLWQVMLLGVPLSLLWIALSPILPPAEFEF